MTFLFDEPVARGRKQFFNPRPIVPKTGWKRPTGFPNLSGAGAICWDFEAKDLELRESGPGWGRGAGHPVGLAVSTDDGYCAYYPVAHEDTPEDNFPVDEVIMWASETLERSGQWDVFWNGLYDWGWLLHWGIKVNPNRKIWDGWIAEKLIRHQNSASLEDSGQRRIGKGKKAAELLRWVHQYFGRGPTPTDDEDLDDSLKKYIYATPPSLAGPYAEEDTRLPLGMAGIQEKLLEEMGLMDVFNMECQLIPLLAEMRFRGVRVDLPAAERADATLTKTVEELHREIKHLAGRTVEVNSSADVGEVLLAQGIKVPLTKKTKKPSVTADFLEALDLPVAEKISEVRELIKFQGTFIQGAILKKSVKGRVHCNFNPLKAITGRFSSNAPNLQNIPSRNPELAPVVRRVFGHDDGHDHFRKYDYSGVENRMLAHFAVGRNSDALREEYCQNPKTDYHNFTTAMVKKETGLDLPRKSIKNVNFAICLAEGQLVLTQRGEVPIEEIRNCDLLWDGVEWVRHDGVIYKGLHHTITYDGLTATPDHKIWTADGQILTLAEASAQQVRLCRTSEKSSGASSPIARTFVESGQHSKSRRERLSFGRDDLQALRDHNSERPSEYGKRVLCEMPLHLEGSKISVRQTREYVKPTILLHGPTLPQNNAQSRQALSWKRNQGRVYVSGRLCNLGISQMARRDFQREGFRPGRQRRELLQREFAVSYQVGEYAQPPSVEENGIRDSTSSLPKGLSRSSLQRCPLLETYGKGLRERSRNTEPLAIRRACKESQGTTRVYDILNAGPRRRFTCSGVLVSNCYGAGDNKLAKMLKLPKPEVEPFFAAYHSGMPYVRETLDYYSRETARKGYTETILGRRVEFDDWEPAFWQGEGVERRSYSLEEAVKQFGSNIRRANLYCAVNYIFQGSAADLMKTAILKCWKAGLYDVIGNPLLLVHDEAAHSSPDDSAHTNEAFDEMKRIFESAIKFRVPILVEGEKGANWGDTQKIH